MNNQKSDSTNYSTPVERASAPARLSLTLTKRLSDGRVFRNLVLEVSGRRFRLSENTNFAEIINELLLSCEKVSENGK